MENAVYSNEIAVYSVAETPTTCDLQPMLNAQFLHIYKRPHHKLRSPVAHKLPRQFGNYSIGYMEYYWFQPKFKSGAPFFELFATI